MVKLHNKPLLQNKELKVIKCGKTHSEKHQGDTELKMVVDIEKLFELYEKHGSKDRFKSLITTKITLLVQSIDLKLF